MRGRNNLSKKVSIDELYERMIVPEEVFYFGDWSDTEIDDKIKIIRQLKLKECVPVHTMNSLQKNTNFFLKEILKYQQAGLNVDKGDAEFGYGMPLPEKGENYRGLVIFRRHEGR